MAYAEVDARRQILDRLGQASDELARALAAIGAAYDQLDEQQADRLEEQLFRPVQRAYGRAKRTHTEFAARYSLSGREFATPTAGPPSGGVKGFIQEGVAAVERAEAQLVGLQESDMAIEVGDPELRAGLTEVRQLIAGVPRNAHGLLRSFGR